MAIKTVSAEKQTARPVATATNIAAPGFVKTVEWASVPGVTAAEVAEASVSLSPAVVRETSQDVSVQNDGGWVVTIPAGKRVKSLSLIGLKLPGGAEIVNSGDLAGNRLAVSFPPAQGSGWESPRFSVPHVGAQGMVPASLTGASFSNRVLSLGEAVAARKVRVTMVSGGTPQEFAAQAAEISRIHLITETPARNLKVAGPDNTTLWQLPEFDPNAPNVDVDLRAPLELALNAALQSGQPIKASFTISADAPAEAFVRFSTARGALLRVSEGILRIDLTGDDATLALGDPLASETPQSAIGDLTVKYAGIRILENVSDEPPAAGAIISGRIVGNESGLRIFPPKAFDGISPARVGIVGRAPEACELSLEFVSVTGDLAGPPLGPPAALKLDAGNDIRTHWAEAPQGVVLSGLVGLRVRANRGRFFWVYGEQHPLVRIAILDPDPGGRPLHLGTSILKEIRRTESHETAFSFPAAVFKGAVPALRSNLFLTVAISDLTLRYAR